MKLKYKQQVTQSYWAGYLTALLYNIFQSRKNLPALVLCMRDFSHLKIAFGKYYTLLKNDKRANPTIQIYEKFDSRLALPSELKGTFSDFMIGYSDAIKKHKLNSDDISNIEYLKIPFDSSN